MHVTDKASLACCIRRCPMDRVCQNLLHDGVVEGWAGLVTGMKIENLTKTAIIGHTAAENIAGLKPSRENELIGSRNGEGLAVKLLVNTEIQGNSFGNWVIGHHVPNNSVHIVAPS